MRFQDFSALQLCLVCGHFCNYPMIVQDTSYESRIQIYNLSPKPAKNLILNHALPLTMLKTSLPILSRISDGPRTEIFPVFSPIEAKTIFPCLNILLLPELSVFGSI